MKDIDEKSENLLLSKIMEAVDRNTPKISYRRLSHPEINNERREQNKSPTGEPN